MTVKEVSNLVPAATEGTDIPTVTTVEERESSPVGRIASGILATTGHAALLYPLDSCTRENMIRLSRGEPPLPLSRFLLKGNLYRGVGFWFSSRVPSNIALLATIDPLRERLGNGLLAHQASILSACALEVLLGSPPKTLLLRLQRDPLLKSIREVWHQLPKGNRLRTLYQGSGSALISSALFNLLYWPLAETIERKIDSDTTPTPTQRAIHSIAAGALSGGVSSSASYWLYVVENMQKLSEKPLSLWNAMREIYKSDGFLGFYRGFLPSFMRMGLAGAITRAAVSCADSIFKFDRK